MSQTHYKALYKCSVDFVSAPLYISWQILTMQLIKSHECVLRFILLHCYHCH